jgi:anti-anti-sigma factor
MKFEIEHQVMDSGVLVLALSGTMTATSPIRDLELLLEELARNQQPRIVVDMAGISHIDSSAIGILVGGHILVKESGGQLRLAALTDRVRTVFRIAGVESLLNLDPSRDAALSALGANL